MDTPHNNYYSHTWAITIIKYFKDIEMSLHKLRQLIAILPLCCDKL